MTCLPLCVWRIESVTWGAIRIILYFSYLFINNKHGQVVFFCAIMSLIFIRLFVHNLHHETDKDDGIFCFSGSIIFSFHLGCFTESCVMIIVHLIIKSIFFRVHKSQTVLPQGALQSVSFYWTSAGTESTGRGWVTCSNCPQPDSNACCCNV